MQIFRYQRDAHKQTQKENEQQSASQQGRVTQQEEQNPECKLLLYSSRSAFSFPLYLRLQKQNKAINQGNQMIAYVS